MPTVRAHAKVNLFLHVLARETSGYHQIETLFCLIDLADELTIEAGPDGIQFESDGAVPGDPEDNLVCRAARAFCARAGIRAALRIALIKRIPVGAGLGGGSSDAAATLRALNELHGQPLEPRTILDIGATLGSDVPFFVAGASLALAWGRGDRMIELDPLPALPMIVAAPAEPMPTADAYSALATTRADAGLAGSTGSARSLGAGGLSDWDTVAQLAHNDFESLVTQRIPMVGTLHAMLLDGGARFALMCGSGSAVFGVFDDAATTRTTAGAMRAAMPSARILETRSIGPGRR